MKYTCIGSVYVVFVCLAHVTLYAQVMPLSFDSPFSASLYQHVLDESMNIYGDVQELHDGIISAERRLIITDVITGRIVRLTGIVDELVAQQKKTGACLQEDGAYLEHILDRMQAAYQAIRDSHHYRMLIPLFINMRRTLLQSFDLPCYSSATTPVSVPETTLPSDPNSCTQIKYETVTNPGSAKMYCSGCVRFQICAL